MPFAGTSEMGRAGIEPATLGFREERNPFIQTYLIPVGTNPGLM